MANIDRYTYDETDGPIQVFFGPASKNVRIDLAAPRELLDRAEADLLRRRREWQEPEDPR